MVFHRGILSSLRTAYFATAAYLPTRADISRWYATIFTYKLNRQIICLNISSTNIFVFLQRGGFTFIKRLIGLSIIVASEAWLVLSFSPYGAMAASRGVEPLSSAWQANILTVERRSHFSTHLINGALKQKAMFISSLYASNFFLFYFLCYYYNINFLFFQVKRFTWKRVSLLWWHNSYKSKSY